MKVSLARICVPGFFMGVWRLASGVWRRVRCAYPPYGRVVSDIRRVRFAYPPYGPECLL
ncbi:hypothetical protein SMC80_000626 [Cronobacter sakazakii]|nr:hypothetical protein [Cronobacter sakazakii]